MEFNRIQKLILLAYIVGIVLLCVVFVPWKIGDELRIGYSPLWLPIRYTMYTGSGILDGTVLAVEVTALTLISVAAILFFNKKH